MWGNVKRLPCKGSWTRVHERTEGLKGIALFIQIPYAPKKSLRLALTRPTSLYKGGKIPPACLDEALLPLQGRQNPSGLLCGNPPPFTREAMAKMTEGLKSLALIYFNFAQHQEKSLRLALTRLTFLCKRGEVERREKSEQRIMT